VDRDASLRVCFTGLDPLAVEDRSLGPVRFDPRVHRDLVVRRRDGIHAYHLAVVVDDHDSGVTDVVRGADLLEATAWQIGLQCLLGMPAPGYLHLPVVTEADGSKLAKSHRTVALDACSATSSLRLALSLLSQDVPPPARGERPAGLLRLAQARWDPARFRGRRCVPLVADARC
jgi:glutamyl-Q tRNA(Asp) synthetase